MSKPPKEAEPEPAPDGADGSRRKLPPKTVLIGAAAGLVVLVGGGAGALLLMGHGGGAHAEHRKSGLKIKAAAKGAEDKKSEKELATLADGPDGVAFYTLPDMVVNIQSADSRPAFLKLKLAFEVDDQAAVDALEPNRPRLTDMFTGFLRELRPEDLAGSQGSWQLRQEIQKRVNLIIAPAKIKAVLIQEMLVQ